MRAASAQIALPFVLIVSGIIVEIAIAGAFLAYFLSTSSLGDKLAARAYTAAYAGLEDAMSRISQNKEFISSSPCSGSPCSYSLTVGSDNSALTITRTSDSVNNLYTYTIISLGSAGIGAPRKKNLIATIFINQTTGELSLQSITDQPAS